MFQKLFVENFTLSWSMGACHSDKNRRSSNINRHCHTNEVYVIGSNKEAEFSLRYSQKYHTKLHRLDALDKYNIQSIHSGNGYTIYSTNKTQSLLLLSCGYNEHGQCGVGKRSINIKCRYLNLLRFQV